MTTDYPPDIRERIDDLLREALCSSYVSMEDMSAKHARHSGARKSGGGHYIVTVVSSEFEGKSLIERHRLVYRAVSPVRQYIHALGITALTPAEWDESRP